MRIGWLAAAVVALAACSADSGVATESARRSAVAAPPPTTAAEPTPGTDPAGPTTAPVTTVPATTTAPPTTVAGPTSTTTPPTTGAAAPAGAVLDVGDAKPPRPYDDLVRAALADIEQWWSEQYPAIYGGPYEPLRGGVFAAYPERTAPIPGCGTSEPTTYADIAEYSAFYCAQGDFLAYDDGEDGVLYGLATEFGSPIFAVVLAHEFAHVVQARNGTLERGLPTITTEQQADCVAGAWVARAARGEAAGIAFSDADVRTGLIAMIAVRDPVGIDPFAAGGHGSAFDRVGAFQVGFAEGLGRCSQLLDTPLPLVPNTFRPGRTSDGNAEFGTGPGQIVPIVVDDLNDYWSQVLETVGVAAPRLEVVPVDADGEGSCEASAATPLTGALYCRSTGQVFLDEPFARDLYDRFGDFAVGYLLGVAWSEAAQHALGSPLAGEDRALANDCLTGAWVGDIIPDEEGRTPRGQAEVEPGDLDEAIQTALAIGDPSSTDDRLGSGFEKIASFREGVLGGFDACTVRIDD